MANHDPYKPLYQEVRRGDLDAVKKFIDEHPSALKATISPEYGYNVLQPAVLAGHVHIVEELVRLISEQDLEIKSGGFTALAFASIYGEITMAEAMVKKNKEILGICSENGSIPVSLAFSYGRNEMARYLYEATPYDVLVSGKGTVAATIITQAIVHQINYGKLIFLVVSIYSMIMNLYF